MRTDAEKKDFAKACLEIEKKGGNVQEYIALNWPSYTPRATWYRLQLQFLKRKSFELTEGRPNIKKGDEEMRKQKNSQDETAKGLLDWVRKGRNPATYLAGEGFANPASALRNIKDYAKKHYSPEIVEEICRITLRGAKAAPAEPKASENPPKEVKAAETVDFNGKEYEKFEGVKDYPPLSGATDKDAYGNHPVTAYIEKESSPTCCHPAKTSGVTVPDDLPKESPMEVIGIRSKVKGYYMKADLDPKLTRDDGYVHLIWRDLITKGELSIGMSVSEWMELSKEIPMAMQQLGLLSK